MSARATACGPRTACCTSTSSTTCSPTAWSTTSSRCWCAKPATTFVRTPTLELAAARLAFATGRPRDALEPLDWLVSLDDDAIVATGASYDERVFGEWAWSLLGLCRFALGDDAAAADAFGRAEQLAPDDASYGVRRRLAEARAATPAG